MSDLKQELRLSPQDLTWTGPAEGLIFGTTAGIEAVVEIVGQDRAVKAIKRGLAMKSHGYNIFVSGTNGTGRTATVKKLLEEFNVGGPVPNDMCYVNNFKDPDHPRLIVLLGRKGNSIP